MGYSLPHIYLPIAPYLPTHSISTPQQGVLQEPLKPNEVFPLEGVGGDHLQAPPLNGAGEDNEGFIELGDGLMRA